MNKSISIRNSLGLTQQEMAKILNIRLQHLSEFERGMRHLPSDTESLIRYLHQYIGWASGYRMAVKTPSDYVAIRKVLGRQLQENEQRRQKLAPLLQEAEKIQKQQLLKKKVAMILTGGDKSMEKFWPSRLIECLEMPSQTANEADLYSYRTQMKVLLFEKRQLEVLLCELQLQMESLKD